MLIWGLVFAGWLKGAKYPDPAAIPDPRAKQPDAL
jgi:hypothetical protein